MLLKESFFRFRFLLIPIFILAFVMFSSCRTSRDLEELTELTGSPNLESFVDLVNACNDSGRTRFFHKLLAQCLCSEGQLAYYSHEEEGYICNSKKPVNFIQKVVGGVYRSVPGNVETCSSSHDESYTNLEQCLNGNYFSTQMESLALESNHMYSYFKFFFPTHAELREGLNNDSNSIKTRALEILKMSNWFTENNYLESAFPVAFLSLPQSYKEYLGSVNVDKRNIDQVSFNVYIGPQKFDLSLMKEFYLSYLSKFYFHYSLRNKRSLYKIIYYEPNGQLNSTELLPALKSTLGINEGNPKSIPASRNASVTSPSLEDVGSDSIDIANQLYNVYTYFQKGCFEPSWHLLTEVANQPHEVIESTDSESQLCAEVGDKKIEFNHLDADCLRDQCVISIFRLHSESSASALSNLQNSSVTRRMVYIGGVLVYDFLVLEKKLSTVLSVPDYQIYGMIDLNRSQAVSTYHIFSDVSIDYLGALSDQMTISAFAQIFDRNWKPISKKEEIAISSSDLDEFIY